LLKDGIGIVLLIYSIGIVLLIYSIGIVLLIDGIGAVLLINGIGIMLMSDGIGEIALIDGIGKGVWITECRCMYGVKTVQRWGRGGRKGKRGYWVRNEMREREGWRGIRSGRVRWRGVRTRVGRRGGVGMEIPRARSIGGVWAEDGVGMQWGRFSVEVFYERDMEWVKDAVRRRIPEAVRFGACAIANHDAWDGAGKEFGIMGMDEGISPAANLTEVGNARNAAVPEFIGSFSIKSGGRS
jgi:hypothetical protein